jgi:hypothetical protein
MHQTAQFCLERAYIIPPPQDPVVFHHISASSAVRYKLAGDELLHRTHARTRPNAPVSVARSCVKPGAVPTDRGAYN